MTELEQMKHGVWNDNFDFNQSKLYVSTPAQKRQYQMQGIPTESNGEPKYSELYDDDIIHIKAYNGNFKVKIYKFEKYKKVQFQIKLMYMITIHSFQ